MYLSQFQDLSPQGASPYWTKLGIPLKQGSAFNDQYNVQIPSFLYVLPILNTLLEQAGALSVPMSANSELGFALGGVTTVPMINGL
jgi:hypothetical protein